MWLQVQASWVPGGRVSPVFHACFCLQRWYFLADPPNNRPGDLPAVPQRWSKELSSSVAGSTSDSPPVSKVGRHRSARLRSIEAVPPMDALSNLLAPLPLTDFRKQP